MKKRPVRIIKFMWKHNGQETFAGYLDCRMSHLVCDMPMFTEVLRARRVLKATRPDSAAELTYKVEGYVRDAK